MQPGDCDGKCWCEHVALLETRAGREPVLECHHLAGHPRAQRGGIGGLDGAVGVERDRGGVIERRTDGSVVIEVDVRSPGAFRSWLFGMGDHAVVLNPPEMVNDVVTWLKALASSK